MKGLCLSLSGSKPSFIHCDACAVPMCAKLVGEGWSRLGVTILPSSPEMTHAAQYSSP